MNVSFSIPSTLTPEAAFCYVVDFANLPEWDPTALRATRLGEGPLDVGATWRVDVGFRGNNVTMPYTLVAYDPDRWSARLRGDHKAITIVDTIRVEPRPEGCAVCFEVEVTLGGALRLIPARVVASIVELAMGPTIRSLAARLERLDKEA